jgi:PAS domain S-box-containing protein
MIDVLLIDDEPQILELTKFFLEREGKFEAETALSGRIALDMMVHRTYDAVVSDYQMPELDGLELLKILRAQGNDVPFVLFTGRGREDVAIDALNNGADYYIQKGGDPKSQFAELAHMIGQSVQQRRAERELRKSEERYKLIFETTGTAMAVVDEDGTMMLVNTEFEKLLSYSREELEGKMRYNDLIAKEDLARVTGYFRARLVDPKAPPRQYELRLTDKRGVAKSVLATVAMIPGTKARLASIIDLSGLKRTEEELRKSETRYKALFENAGDAIHILDFEGKILEANQISNSRLGYTREELLQKRIRDITTSEYASLIPARFKKLREDGRLFYRSANIHRNGTIIQLEVNSRIVDFEGSPAIFSSS